jgi:hypothetical protein
MPRLTNLHSTFAHAPFHVADEPTNVILWTDTKEGRKKRRRRHLSANELISPSRAATQGNGTDHCQNRKKENVAGKLKSASSLDRRSPSHDSRNPGRRVGLNKSGKNSNMADIIIE